VQLHRDREQFEQAGVRLVVIGQGTPAHARHFLETNHVEGLELLVDPRRESYAVAGTKVATIAELWGPRIVLEGAYKAIKMRLPQTRTIGHPAQLGGVMIVQPDGTVAYTYLAEDASDNAPTDEVLAAARDAAS
jgi:peroxiredoxin